MPYRHALFDRIRSGGVWANRPVVRASWTEDLIEYIEVAIHPDVVPPAQNEGPGGIGRRHWATSNECGGGRRWSRQVSRGRLRATHRGHDAELLQAAETVDL